MRSRKRTDAPSARAPIERAYLERGLVAAMDLLTYVSRAITPSHSFRRFNTRFFLSDGNNVFGEPMASEELEDVGWHPIGREALASFRDVTRFMLARGVARGDRARQGTALLLGQERPPHRHLPRGGQYNLDGPSAPRRRAL